MYLGSYPIDSVNLLPSTQYKSTYFLLPTMEITITISLTSNKIYCRSKTHESKRIKIHNIKRNPFTGPTAHGPHTSLYSIIGVKYTVPYTIRSPRNLLFRVENHSHSSGQRNSWSKMANHGQGKALPPVSTPLSRHPRPPGIIWTWNDK